MYKNYFFLLRITEELNSILHGATLTEAFCQEKDILVLEFDKEHDNIYLEINTSQKNPSISIKNIYSKARKNVVNFFSDILPLQISGISIDRFERTIIFSSLTVNFAFIYKGADTNFVNYSGSDILGTFKSLSDKARPNIEKRITTIRQSHLSEIQIEFDTIIFPSLDTIKKEFPYLGNEIIDELKYRANKYEFDINKEIKEIVSDVLTGELTLQINYDTNEPRIVPNSFAPFSINISESGFNALDLLRQFVIESSKTQVNLDHLKQIGHELKKRISNLDVRINKLTELIANEERIAQVRKLGELLSANIYRIAKGDSIIEVEDFYDNNKLLTIELKEGLTPQQNIDIHFKKARSLEQSVKRSLEEIPLLQTKRVQLQKQLEDFNAMSMDELKELNKNIEQKKKLMNKDKEIAKTIKFIIDDKFTLLVGKDSRNNDLLTLHIAKPEDIWLHARSVPGSHVVIQTNNTKDEVQKSVIKKAASVAAFYSKAKNAGLVPVSYTKKKYVSKRKGSPDGQVMLMREESVMVKPCIPEGVVIVKDDNTGVIEF